MARVLIVEDDASLCELYREELVHEGYDVATAGDGAAAVEEFREREPDAVVLDIRMPGMDGIEALEELLQVNATVPVIINTAYNSYKENFMTWAAEAYVIKSSDTSELKSVLRRALEKRGLG